MNLNALADRWSKSTRMPRAPRSDGERFGFFSGGAFRWIPFVALALGSQVLLGGSLTGVFGSALIVAADVALPVAVMATASIATRSMAAAIREREWATFPKAVSALSKCFMADAMGMGTMFAHAVVFLHAKTAEMRRAKAVRAPGASQKTLWKLSVRHARAQARKAKISDFSRSVIHARQDFADAASAVLGDREAWRRARMWLSAGQPERAMKIFQARPFDPRWPCPLPRLDEADDPGVGRRALIDRILFRKSHQLSFAEALRVSALHPEAVPMALYPDRLRVFLDFVASMAATVDAIELKQTMASVAKSKLRAAQTGSQSTEEAIQDSRDPRAASTAVSARNSSADFSSNTTVARQSAIPLGSKIPRAGKSAPFSPSTVNQLTETTVFGAVSETEQSRPAPSASVDDATDDPQASTARPSRPAGARRL